LNWGNLTDEQYKEKAVWKKEHSNYSEFETIWKQMLKETNSLHTLQGEV
jgi:hypothetical protein